MRRVAGEDARGGRRTRGMVKRLLVGLLVAGVTVACGPAEGDGAAVPLPPAATSVVPSQTSAEPSLSPSPSPSSTPTPSASPSPTSARPSPAAPAATRTADPKPPATRTTKPVAPATTKASAPPAKAECEIVSNAGNCYNAGQFCRKADLGRSTHAGNGRMIHCRLDGTQPRWQY
ncbi:hypothetical protein OHA91_23285 [Streptomyces erythrochromogenes]|uniref:DUF3761 domain-containing protein n=1 Tax=Streptomyces erythrochromogenes TaxID=285574 RepID=A0ABZ1QEW7_9ACTN|nr:hypothetical protein [Streptomyces erythrochromogenes]